MSPTDRAPAARAGRILADGRERSLCGWGRTARSRALLVRPIDGEEVAGLLAERPPGGVIARGAGRSYGDPAQNAGGVVLDATGLCGALHHDAAAGTVRARAGTSIARLITFLATRHAALPVVPGTRHLTVGGAIASDVHGKNHPRDGSFGRQVESLLLCTPGRGILRASAEEEVELFHATLGGMGLTGVILEATLRTEPHLGPRVLAEVTRAAGLTEAVALMSGPGPHRHQIAWLDLMGGSGRFGRAVVTRSHPAAEASPPDGSQPAQAPRRGIAGDAAPDPPFRSRPLATVPPWFPGWPLRVTAVDAFNRWHWRRARLQEPRALITLEANLFPLDALGEWNRLYGRGGLVQYQFVVPAGAESALVEVLDRLRGRQIPMYLAVLKRFGEPSGGLLSFPIEGWTIAIDIPAEADGVGDALEHADRLVADAGGRVYLAKDCRMKPDSLRAMYPSLERFLRIRGEADPEGVLRSDMGRRLELCA